MGNPISAGQNRRRGAWRAAAAERRIVANFGGACARRHGARGAEKKSQLCKLAKTISFGQNSRKIGAVSREGIALCCNDSTVDKTPRLDR
ncbi:MULTISPECIES: hypothetical protein [unclassified Janthinobacterium]|uniref:hypothetical protein n=1 Tax=unclassified Janthinobacterium TaxID=2610881 RepID=UPI0025B60DFA|nr:MULTISPECIES: hypothetical protein [unclassified Janthinobacterium]MDN2673331.1 hypothetical protein [Janthinobacterium sp. SUN026]MDN2717650.1 hypothetical protein [Janthinobacterium sp. SUN120]MDO8041460.1 hypothetical protein [Janthinobacterium sp. SUN137]